MPALSSNVGEPATLIVVTYNIRAGIGPGPFPPLWWRRIDDSRLERMADLILATGADVVSLQEVALASIDGWSVDQPALLGRLTGMDFRYGAACALPLVEPPPSNRVVGSYLWGNVILSRHPIEKTALHALPITADDDPAEPIDTEPRCALMCTIATPGGRVHMISTHLAYLGRRARRPQVDRLAQIVTQTRGPLILAGDLNAAIDEPELSALEPLLVDAFAARGVPAGDERRRSCGSDPLDQVLVRGFELEECRVAHEAGDLSDHWPVIARLHLSGGSGSSGSATGPAPG